MVKRYEMGVMESGSSGDYYPRLMESQSGDLIHWADHQAALAYIEKLEERIAKLEQLTNAVTCDEFTGIACQDVRVDGQMMNWFDRQAALQGKES